MEYDVKFFEHGATEEMTKCMNDMSSDGWDVKDIHETGMRFCIIFERKKVNHD